MNGALTFYELDAMRAKAKAFDEALAYILGRADNERAMVVEQILKRGKVAADTAMAQRVTKHA